MGAEMGNIPAGARTRKKRGGGRGLDSGEQGLECNEGAKWGRSEVRDLNDMMLVSSLHSLTPFYNNMSP